MSYTKRQLVEMAFEEIGYSSYQFDMEPEQQESALRRLDSMMASWYQKGLVLGYPLVSSPKLSDLDDDSNLSESAIEAVYLGLAIRIAPTVGKEPSRATKTSAREAYRSLLADNTKPPVKVPSSINSGAGNKPRYGTNRGFINPIGNKINSGNGVILDLD